jgi:hypothetical protein
MTAGNSVTLNSWAIVVFSTVMRAMPNRISSFDRLTVSKRQNK